MTFKRLSVLLLTLVLAGCYQQASDNFETVNSEGNGAQTLSTATVQIISPNLDASPVVIVPEGSASATPDGAIQVIQPTSVEQPLDVTPTVVVIMPVIETNTPLAPDTALLLPTATPPMLITPQSPSQLAIPTATPAGVATNANGQPVNTSGIITPTALALPTNAACMYVVKGGDNLFRIALNNNTTLADLLLVNNLSEQSVIQPGQEIQLPNCDDGTTNAALGATAQVTGGNGAPATLESSGVVGTGSSVTHTVASGETLSTIAQRYGVTVQAIITANNLTNPDRLSIGQQLIIPQ